MNERDNKMRPGIRRLSALSLIPSFSARVTRLSLSLSRSPFLIFRRRNLTAAPAINNKPQRRLRYRDSAFSNFDGG